MLAKLFIFYIVCLSIMMVYVVEKEKKEDSEKDLKKELKNETKRYFENF